MCVEDLAFEFVSYTILGGSVTTSFQDLSLVAVLSFGK